MHPCNFKFAGATNLTSSTSYTYTSSSMVPLCSDGPTVDPPVGITATCTKACKGNCVPFTTHKSCYLDCGIVNSIMQQCPYIWMSCGPGSGYIVVVFIVVYYDDEYILMSIYIYAAESIHY